MPRSISHEPALLPGAETAPQISARNFAVEGITCAACVQAIEEGLAGLPGILDARVNLSTHRLSVRWDGRGSVATVVGEKLKKLGYRAHPLRKVAEHDEQQYAQWLLRCLAVSGFAAMNVMLLSVSVWSGNVSDITNETRDFFHWLSALIVLPAVAYAGQPFFRSALGAIAARRVNMDVPISLGIVLAIGLSLYETATHGIHAYFDSAIMLLFFLLTGRYLEQITRQRMRNAAHNISSLRAPMAVRIEGKRLNPVEVETLQPGDLVLVRPGERFPADGVIIEGEGSIDESIATGETAGTVVREGRSVLAGTMSLDGSFRVRVRSLARNSFVENLERLIDTAVNARLPYMQLANRAARSYAPVVHTAALLTLIGWLFAGAGWHDAIVTAIAVLIITCPCALALAVPTVQVVAMGEMFRQKILVNSVDLAERLADVDTIVFDKTGTLTLPESAVCSADEVAPGLRKLAARLAAGSRHPLASAISALDTGAEPFPKIVEESGRGVRTTRNGVELRLGSAAFCGTDAEQAPNENVSSIVFRAGDQIVTFHVGQRLRPDAKRVIEALRSRGYYLMILSGDRSGPVEAVSDELGISDWHAQCEPAGKIAALERLRKQGRRVLMVGDGLNDAPALAAAHVSISPIGAADLTQAQADGMFLGEQLAPVADAIEIALQAKAVMRQNLGLAIIYNVIAIPLAIFGHVTPLVAAAAMSGSSILVSLNALRAKWWRHETAATKANTTKEALAT